MRTGLLLLATTMLLTPTAQSNAQPSCDQNFRICVNACGPAKSATEDCVAPCRAVSNVCEASAAAALAKARASDVFESPRQAPRLPALRKPRAPQG